MPGDSKTMARAGKRQRVVSRLMPDQVVVSRGVPGSQRR